MKKRSNFVAAFLLTALFAAGTPVTVQAEQTSARETVMEEETLTKEQADRIIGFIIEKISSGALDSEEAVQEAIAEGEEKFQITLTEKEKENIITVVNTVNSWEFDTDELAEKAKELYEKYGTGLLENPEQAVREAAKDEAKGFMKSVGDFFVNAGKEVATFFKDGAEKLLSFF